MSIESSFTDTPEIDVSYTPEPIQPSKLQLKQTNIAKKTIDKAKTLGLKTLDKAKFSGMYDADSPFYSGINSKSTGRVGSQTGRYANAPEMGTIEGMNARIKSDNFLMGVDSPGDANLDPRYDKQYTQAMNQALIEESNVGNISLVGEEGHQGKYGRQILDMKRGENRCTCPIGKDCKHVHATMKALEEGFYIESTDPSIELNPEMAVDRFFLENPKQGLEIIIKELEYMLDNDESGSEVVRLFRKCFRLLKIYPSEEHFLKIKKDFNEFQRLFGDWALTEYLGEEINEAEKLLSNPS